MPMIAVGRISGFDLNEVGIAFINLRRGYDGLDVKNVSVPFMSDGLDVMNDEKSKADIVLLYSNFS